MRPHPPRFVTRTPLPIDTGADDALIRDAVIDQFTRTPGLDLSEVEVTVTDGLVTLRGAVPSIGQKWQLEQLAASVIGVTGVRVALEALRGPADK